MSVCASNMPSVMWHRSWRSVVSQGRARDDPAEKGGGRTGNSILQHLCVAGIRHALTHRLQVERCANLFVGASYRNQPNQETTGAKTPSPPPTLPPPQSERVHNTDSAVTLNDITDPRPRLSVALSIVLETHA